VPIVVTNQTLFMSTFIIDVPVPSMGATVSELTVIRIAVQPGATVTRGQKLAALESDKSAFDFESPCDGTVLEIRAKNGAVINSGEPFLRLETSDQSLRHLEIQRTEDRGQSAEKAAPRSPPSSVLGPLTWTPRAIKMVQEAGLDHATIVDIAATGPGGRVSGDDVTKYLAGRK